LLSWWRMSWTFDRGCIGNTDCFRQYSHFHSIDSADPWAWDVLPSSNVFLDFFLLWFIIFIYRSFTSWIKSIPPYFNFVEVIVNGIVCLISSSYYPLFVYKNATDFCVLILYPATLLNVFVRYKRFVGRVFRVFQV
jgi:hypothetical protein